MFLATTVSSLMAYFVAILTPNSARSCVMQSTLPTKGMKSIISTVSISLKDFLPSILLLYGDDCCESEVLKLVTFPSMLCRQSPMKGLISLSEVGTMSWTLNMSSVSCWDYLHCINGQQSVLPRCSKISNQLPDGI
ncbi:hypothetical protein Tco_0223152 [Tanacetum coccineum]